MRTACTTTKYNVCSMFNKITLIFTNAITNLFFDTLDDEPRGCRVAVARHTSVYEHDADDDDVSVQSSVP